MPDLLPVLLECLEAVKRIVNLEFENHLVGVMIDRFGQDIMIMSKDNEHSVTRVQVNVSTQFYGWLAALGNSVRVISPENVRKEYRDFLKKSPGEL